MTENHTEALALAQEYMANAIRIYKEAGHDPAGIAAASNEEMAECLKEEIRCAQL